MDGKAAVLLMQKAYFSICYLFYGKASIDYVQQDSIFLPLRIEKRAVKKRAEIETLLLINNSVSYMIWQLSILNSFIVKHVPNSITSEKKSANKLL